MTVANSNDIKISVDDASINALRAAFADGARDIVAATSVLERRVARLEKAQRFERWFLVWWLVGSALLITFAKVMS